MSTRSITHIYEMESLSPDKIVCSFYRHSDGYPTGHGDDLASWLSGKRLVNGISKDFNPSIDFNRAGTMAVRLAAHIQDISGCEMMPTGASGAGEEYTYHVTYDDRFYIRIDDGKKVAAPEFNGEKIQAEYPEGC